jgi:hypothetical protein
MILIILVGESGKGSNSKSEHAKPTIFIYMFLQLTTVHLLAKAYLPLAKVNLKFRIEISILIILYQNK